MTSLWLFIFEKWCKNVPCLQKVISRKKSFLLVSWRLMTKIAGSGSISQSHRSEDPDPYTNVTDSQHSLEVAWPAAARSRAPATAVESDLFDWSLLFPLNLVDCSRHETTCFLRIFRREITNNFPINLLYYRNRTWWICANKFILKFFYLFIF